MERFDVFAEKAAAKEEPVQSVETVPLVTNGHHKHTRDVSTAESKTASPMKREAKSEDLSDMVDDAPPKKKRKSMSAEDDAALAARLQAEEDTRSRPTRGAPRRAAPAKKKKATPKKKSSRKIKDNSGDEGDDSDASAEKPVRNTGFHKPLNLSPALADLLGETTLSRPQMTKKIWEYIKGQNLQDPKDKRIIRCDDKMRAVLKVEKVQMFQMTKLLSENMYNPEE